MKKFTLWDCILIADVQGILCFSVIFDYPDVLVRVLIIIVCIVVELLPDHIEIWL